MAARLFYYHCVAHLLCFLLTLTSPGHIALPRQRSLGMSQGSVPEHTIVGGTSDRDSNVLDHVTTLVYVFHILKKTGSHKRNLATLIKFLNDHRENKLVESLTVKMLKIAKFKHNHDTIDTKK